MDEFREMFLQVYMWPTIAVAALCSGTYFLRKYVRAVERNTEARITQQQLGERVGVLEEMLESTQREVATLRAAHDFSSRLLEARTADSP